MKIEEKEIRKTIFWFDKWMGDKALYEEVLFIISVLFFAVLVVVPSVITKIIFFIS